jgi:hypothetical protein
MYSSLRSLGTALAFVGVAGLIHAQVNLNPNSDPKESREDARKIAVKFRDRGYNISPIANGDNFKSQTIFNFELTKGLDCVFMVGIDEAMPDVDLYVKDDVGNMVAQDTRTIRRACVEFTASSNGVYTIIVKPTPSAVMGHFTVLGGFQPSGY